MQPVPSGWKVSLDAEGKLCLIRGAECGHRERTAVAAVVAVWITWQIWRFSRSRGGGWQLSGTDDLIYKGILIAAVAAVAVVLLGHLAWVAFRREEWRLGTDFLEVRRELFGFHSRRIYSGVTLTVTSYCASVYMWRRVCRLQADRPWGSDVLYSGWFISTPDMEALARFVAAHTGWPVNVNTGAMAWLGDRSWP